MEKFQKNKALNILSILTEILWYGLWAVLTIFICIIFAFLAGVVDLDTIVNSINMDNSAEIIEFFSSSPISTFSITIIMASIQLIIIALGLRIVFHFRKLFKTLKKGKVFVKENAKAFEFIAYLSMAVAVIKFDLSAIFYTLMLFVFAAIFKYGVKLENDKNLTI